MIIPSIDIVGGNAVQLVGGESEAINAGDPFAIAERFSRVGEIAVIDIDRARGEGENSEIIRELARRYPCRVGGGIRDYESAVRWLDDGAEKVIIGTAATPDLLAQLPKERVIAGIDGRDGIVLDQGWRNNTGASMRDRVRDLRDVVGGFLVTFVECEGQMTGVPVDRMQPLLEAAGTARVTFAGGIRAADEIGRVDALGADVQVGMALYTGQFALADAVGSTLRSDRADGLWPTVVVDERGISLGLVYSSRTSLDRAIESGRGVYWSRSRNALWEKGAVSGATQDLIRVDVDCDRDALRFTVSQRGGFCHKGTRTCFGDDRGMERVAARLKDRAENAVAGSYTARLLADPELLRSKLLEEASELAEATEPSDVAWEAADVLYFTLVALTRAGVDLADVERELVRRTKSVTRRRESESPLEGSGAC